MIDSQHIVNTDYLKPNINVDTISNIDTGIDNQLDNRLTNITFVISSTQYSGYGGAATNAYALIKTLRASGYKVAGLFFHNELNVDYDPDKIGGIYLSKYININVGIYDDIYNNVVNYLGKKPDISIAKNYAAPVFCKHIFNNYVVYLVSGIQHLTFLKMTPTDFLNENYVVTYEYPREILCNKVSDLIVLNSELSKKVFEKIYPEFNNKIYKSVVDTSNHLNINDVFAGTIRPNMHRRYDILLCCSNLSRVIKNNIFLIDILCDPRFDKYSKCIIGEDNSKFINIPNSQCIGLLQQQECFKYMIKSKVLLYPSLFDANPNTVREAYSLGCMPLITNNIGYSELFPEVLICKTFDKEEWTNKILHILKNFKTIRKTVISYDTVGNVDKLITDIISNL